MTTVKPRVNIYLSNEMAIKARAEASRLGVSLGALISVALEHYLNHKEAGRYEVLENVKNDNK